MSVSPPPQKWYSSQIGNDCHPLWEKSLRYIASSLSGLQYAVLTVFAKVPLISKLPLSLTSCGTGEPTRSTESSYQSQRVCRLWRGSQLQDQPLRPRGRRTRMGCCYGTMKARPPRDRRAGQGEFSTLGHDRARIPPPPDAPRSYTWRTARERRMKKRDVN